MKNYRNYLVLFLLFGVAFAQNNNAIDAEADALLKSVSEKYQKYTTAKIDLKLTIDLPEMDENQVSDVMAWIEGDKFKIELKDQMFVSDNITLWNYLMEYNEVQINDYEESDAIFSPSIIFNLYSEDYIYRMKEEFKNAAGKLVKVVELTPLNKDQNFFKIDLSIESATNKIVEAKIYERSGMRYTYTINSFTPNVPLEEDFFIFKVADYEDINVIDARF